MKKLVALFGFAMLAVPAAHAGEDLSYPIAMAGIQASDGVVHAQDLINWKVGDEQDYDISMGNLPFGGSMVKTVESDEGTALWVSEDMNLMIQQQKIETLINKADGKILKMKQNGQDMQIPDQKVEVVSQDYTELDVPAGHFKAIHVVANVTQNGQTNKAEIWANPRDTVMEGTLQQLIGSQMGDITMKLKSFKHGS